MNNFGFRTSNFEFKKQSGAALVLTLGILALITILAVSFATLMRIEEKSARIALDLNKARLIAKAGLNHAIAILKKDLSDDQTANDLHDSLDEDWIITFSGTDQNLDNIGGNESKWIYIHEDPADNTSPVIGRYAVLIQDEAGKLNLNAGGPGDQNEGWTAYELDLGAIPEIGAGLANDIVDYREGQNLFPGEDATDPTFQDDNNNNTPLENDDIDNDADTNIDVADFDEGTDDPTEFDPDIPYNDDRSFSSIEELIKVSGIGSTIVAAAKNYSTVWSYDINQFWDGGWNPKVNLNHLSSTSQLLNIIEATNVYRVAANIIDYGDRDYYPTVTTDGVTSYIGLEGLQINEVMTNSSEVERTEEQSTLSPNQGAWTDQGTYDKGNNGGVSDVGNWSWSWDNGSYEMAVEHTDGINVQIDGQAVLTYPSFTSITIAGGTIDLSIEDPTNFDVSSNPIYATFTSIHIRAGKFIEIINISRHDITVDKTGGDSWKINFGGILNNPITDGLPLTVSGGSEIDLSTDSINPSSDASLPKHVGTTYSYLIIADSQYAIDAKFGNDNGTWGDPTTETGTLFAIDSNMHNYMSDGGTDILLVDSENNVVTFAPTTDQWNIKGYGASSANDQSRSRSSSVQTATSTSHWQDSADTPTTTGSIGSPGKNNSNADFTPEPDIKDRPYATIGEVTHVIDEDNGPTDLTFDTSVNNDFFHKLTVNAQRLEAENADNEGSIGWTSTVGGGSDGTDIYTAPGNAGPLGVWTWSLASDTSNKRFRIKNSDNYNFFAYGQFKLDFQDSVGVNKILKPNHGTVVTTSSVNNLTATVSIYGNGTDTPKLDYVVLSPEPYTWGKLNINTATSQVLQALPGNIGSVIAGNIIANRPYNKVQDVIPQLSGAPLSVENRLKKISNLITTRSDVYRVLVKAESIVDLEPFGTEDDTNDQIVSSVSLEAVVDRNPNARFPGITNRYRIEFQKYNYEE